MKLTLDRKYKKQDYTIGKLYINGTYFCDTLEDTDRGLSKNMPINEIKAKKIYGQTAIPRGIYEIKYTYSNKYRKFMLQIMNVPGFEGIRIHSGNTNKDTLGCILLGKNNKVAQVTNSRKTVQQFNDIILPVLKNEKIYLEIL